MIEDHLARLKTLYSYVTGCLVCESCSTEKNPVYMNNCGMNMLWECPKCKHLVMVLLEFHAARSAWLDSEKPHENDKFGWESCKEGKID